MAGNTNEQLQFENVGPRMLYAARYADAQGNVWRIFVAGEPAVVQAFTAQREFLLVAEPLNGDRTLPAMPEQTPGPTIYPNPTTPGGPPQATPDDFFDFPDLEVKIELVEAALPRPFRVSVLIDPCIRPYKSWSAGFSLPGDSYLSFNYSANYSVTVSASSGGSYAGSTGTGGSVGCAGSGNWTVSVKNKVGSDNCFSLSGEINVY
jgi:hypothetical protein